MSNNLKLQLYRITLTIHEINISVKFPCSVATSLKAGIRLNHLRYQINLNTQGFQTAQWKCQGLVVSNHQLKDDVQS